MEQLHPVIGTALVVVLVAFLLVVVVRLLDGTIATAGMLITQQHEGETAGLERQTLLFASVAAAAGYFIYGMKIGLETGRMPDFPEELLPFLGGTNLAYLSGKFMKLKGIIS
ncbi:hypothetical protein [Rhizobium halophytocola]|uniref:Uncharacterized protein n=1 Tax=Rhizobium halophytocola TaxID=735519 RepID=A0ABS4E3N2_9HYPH|nr:hypothetical protein [Rhizobium halophytocola]MBP1852556.1 hypothetical protein [Rhizobium halophytocola]